MAIEKAGKRLAELEKKIEKGLLSFWEMGEAYREVKDSKLYTNTHEHWKDYCRDRWNLARNTVEGVIQAAEVRARLAANGRDLDRLPTNTEQVRYLAALPAAEQPVAWKEAVRAAEAGGKSAPTGKDVAEVVKRRQGGGRTKSAPVREPSRSDLAHDAAHAMYHAAELYLSALRKAIEAVPYLTADEAQGVAHNVALTVSSALAAIEDAGLAKSGLRRGLVSGHEWMDAVDAEVVVVA